MKHLKFAWLLVVLLTLAACGQDVAPDALEATDTVPPTITSDKADYAPGELVMLTGSNWQAGESVHINVDDDQTKSWQRNVDVTADENGNISDQFNIPEWFVATYKVTATGAESGTATASFTDGNVSVQSSGSAIKVKWWKYSGTACTGNSTASGEVDISITTVSLGTPAAGDTGMVKLEASTSAGNQSFSTWSATGSTFRTTSNNPVCFASHNSNRTFTANYVAAPVKVNTTTDLTP